jgi:LAGLIDADG endonuclease
LIPNYIRNNISGWSSYSDKVISQKIDENLMGNRVSKSSFSSNIGIDVKEQRVDGSCLSSRKEGKLRCTLMAHESGYQIRIPSNLNKHRLFSTTGYLHQIPCSFISGFTDAEGSFMIKLTKPSLNRGWRIELEYSIRLHVKEIAILS